MKQTINYFELMSKLGLSQHPNQLKRRLMKYPHHFRIHNGNWYISKRLAKFLKKANHTCNSGNELKKGGFNG